MAYRTYSSGAGFPFGPYSLYSANGSFWLYSPLVSGFTLIPHGSYRSYYGFRFLPLSNISRALAAPTSGARSAQSRVHGAGSSGRRSPIGPVFRGSPRGRR